MIIDSHAHYNVSAYKKPFRYLSYGADGYTLKEGQWGELFQKWKDAGIPSMEIASREAISYQ